MSEKTFFKFLAWMLCYIFANIWFEKTYDFITARRYANRLVSFLHAVKTSICCFYLLSVEPWNLKNSPNQIALLEWSIAYFFFDCLYMFVFERSIVFLLHHSVAIAIEAIIINSGIGGFYGLIGLGLGEVTNPFQIVWMITKERKETFPKLFYNISKFYTIFFVVMRSFVVPPTVIWILVDATQRQVDFKWIFSIACCSISIATASVAWSLNLIKEFEKLKYDD